MRTILKLLIAALVINAAYRVGIVYWDHYQFEDAVQQLAQFAERATEQEIAERVIELAANSDIPIDEDALTVTRGQRRIQVAGAYTRPVAVAPGYTRQWDFTLNVVVLTLN